MTRAERTKKWRLDNPERHKEIARKNAWDAHTRLKLEVFGAYGGECQCCGETELHFLTIDHVHGSVPERHKWPNSGRRISGTPFLQLLKREGYPDDCRVLCWNCNGSHAYYGFCPHQPHTDEQRRYPHLSFA